jgi:hypothetical protein
MLGTIIVILIVLWFLGYFGRGRFYARGPVIDTSGWTNGRLIHALLVIALILLILRLLGVD